MEENPHSSFLWQMKSRQRLAKRKNVDFHVLDMCAYGSRWRKRTRLLLTGVRGEAFNDKLCSGRGVCSYTGRPHEVLTGRRPGEHGWATLKAQAYPARFCSAVAAVLDRASRRTMAASRWAAMR